MVLCLMLPLGVWAQVLSASMERPLSVAERMFSKKVQRN